MAVRPDSVRQDLRLQPVHLDGRGIEILPKWCNYFGMPKVCAETGRFVEPYLPRAPIGILHLAGMDRMRLDPTLEADLLDTEGKALRRTLRYRPAFIRPSAGPAASSAQPAE